VVKKMGEKRDMISFMTFMLDRKQQERRDFIRKLRSKADRLEPVENCTDGSIVWVGYVYWDKPRKLVVFRLLTDRANMVLPDSIRYEITENAERPPSWSEALWRMGVFK
jgi:hypothetical protein